MNESATTIDFVAAMARLLSDPILRAAFARNPALVAHELRVREVDVPRVIQLFALGERAWRLFCQSPLSFDMKQSAQQQAREFSEFLQRNGETISLAELQFLEFSGRLKPFDVWVGRDLLANARMKKSMITLQICTRVRGRVRVLRFHFAG